MKYRLIVFDWDGTLIDSAGTIVQCIQDAARDMGLEVPAAERARHVIGLGLHDSLRHAVPGLALERYRDFADHYRRHFLARQDSMRLFPGVRVLLEELKKDRLLAIATGKSRRGLDRALDADGLRRFFADSRCADETTPKPHPAMLLELMQALQIAKQNTLMVGDTTHDLEMARAAGVDALAVTYGAHAEAGLRACSPLGCFPSVQALAAWLKTNA
ncbi:MAG TPA: HAD-IA family hydrolase [Burkholderiales bacterium]|jgi:phosphoglycolate phosphatase|nr:HAD-IA family hydrolase [Burkholderiales bacterium]